MHARRKRRIHCVEFDYVVHHGIYRRKEPVAGRRHFTLNCDKIAKPNAHYSNKYIAVAMSVIESFDMTFEQARDYMGKKTGVYPGRGSLHTWWLDWQQELKRLNHRPATHP